MNEEENENERRGMKIGGGGKGSYFPYSALLNGHIGTQPYATALTLHSASFPSYLLFIPLISPSSISVLWGSDRGSQLSLLHSTICWISSTEDLPRRNCKILRAMICFSLSFTATAFFFFITGNISLLVFTPSEAVRLLVPATNWKMDSFSWN